MGGVLEDRSIIVEQIRMLVKQAPSLIWLTLLTAVIIFLVLLGRITILVPALWFAAIVFFNGVRFWHYYSARDDKVTVDNVSIHSTIFICIAFIGGSFWGSLALLLPILSDPFMLVLTASLLCGIIAGTVAFLSIYKLAYFAYAIPCAMPLVVRCFLSGDEIFEAIGFLLFLFLLVSLHNSHKFQKKVLRGIKLVKENKNLIKRLKQEKINADEARNIADNNNEAKSRFLATASHDLRQPLHAMGFFIEALQHEKNPVKLKTLIKKVAQTSDALRNLLGSLLDISKIEAGKMEPIRSHFNLNEVLMEIIQEFTVLAQNKGLDLSYNPCVRTVYSDKEMLSRIIRNLVSNAVHNTDLGYVNISCDVENGYVIIQISDSGIGIPHSHKKDIFREFFQISEGRREPTHGLGLGLSIVDGLCRLLDHEIGLKSEIDIGSVFTVKVPQGNLNHVILEAPEQKILPGDVIAKTIILNNEEASRESISGIMRHWGHVVADFNTCAEVIEFLESEDFIPDLVISDIKLQDVSGVDAIDAIQSQIAKKIPGIIMTGEGSGATIDEVRANGFSVLQKPVQPAKLRSMVSYLVQGQDEV